MNLLDMRTIILSHVIGNFICMAVMAVLWYQHRRQFAGLGFWLANFVMQWIALLLIALRGVAPDFMSMTVGNTLIIGGTVLLYIGLETFVGKRGRQVHNYLLLVAFIFSYTYFVYAQPSLPARTIIFSLGLLAICAQCAWLLLRRVGQEMLSITGGVGVVFGLYCLVSILRITFDLAAPIGSDFFHSNIYDTVSVLTYQMLLIVSTFNLFLMVNRRLVADLNGDITERKQVEEALRQSEEKFYKAFHSSPDAILISRLSDGQLVEVNEGFCRLTGYTREEALSSSSLALGLWLDPRDREKIVEELGKNRKIREYDFDFRASSGKILNCLYSAEIIQLGGEAHIISVVRDVTERKQAEAALHQQNEVLEALQQTTLDLLSELDLDTLLENIVKRAGALMGTTSGFLDLLEPETGQIRPRVGIGALAESLKHVMRPGEGVAGIVWQSGKPLVVEDYDRWPGRINSFSRNTIRSVVGVPLLSGGQVLGVLGIARDVTSDQVFTQQNVDLLTQFARLVTIAIENARLYQAVQQELAERKRTEGIMGLRLRLLEYAASHSIGELLQKALDEIGNLTDSPIGFYHFVEEDQNTLSLQAWSTRTLAEFCQAEGGGMHYPIREAGVWVDCVHERKPVVHNDYASLPHRKGLPPGHAEVVRELVVPTLSGNRITAILGVGNKPTDYGEKDIELVSYFADIIWAIVEQKRADEQIRQLNARLEQMAMTDDLTGLKNRRSFFVRGAEEIKRALRYQTPLSLLMVDIDEFKQVNDTYGHDIGDLALQCVARTLESNIREIDILARLGGEEFGILLPNTDLNDAARLGERLRSAVEKRTCSSQNHCLNTTVSIGVSTYSHDLLNLDAMLAVADQAMYQAKNQGRNRVVYLG